MKKLILSFFFLGIFISTIAAQTFQSKSFSNSGILYDKEITADLRLHTNGYAFAINVGKMKTYYLTQYYHFEVGELKHHKEYKQNDLNSNFPGGSARSYIFGKQNNLFVARAGFGQKRYFSEKAKRKGLAIGVTYELGPSIGILKPYLLEINNGIDNPSGSTISIQYSEETHTQFLDRTSIEGASGFLKGWNDLSLVPGGQFKLALHFDWGAFDEIVKAFEAGIMGDIYFKKIPIMVENAATQTENRPFFINLYLNLQFGKRW